MGFTINGLKKKELKPLVIKICFFNAIGIEGLNNGLSAEENMKLFKAINTTEMRSLVLKGLMSIKHDG